MVVINLERIFKVMEDYLNEEDGTEDFVSITEIESDLREHSLRCAKCSSNIPCSFTEALMREINSYNN